MVNMKVKLSINKHVDIHTFSTSTSKLNAGKFVGLSWDIYHGCYSSSALKMVQDTQNQIVQPSLCNYVSHSKEKLYFLEIESMDFGIRQT